MKFKVVTFVAALFVVGLSASAQTGTLTVASYGAKCDGTTPDTAAFQSAATAAANSYASTGSPVTITYAGNCVVGGSVSYGSGVHWRGYGVITVPTQAAAPTLSAVNADNVEWDHVEINVLSPFGNNSSAAAIGWSGTDSSQHSHVKITNCRIVHSSFGISVLYNSGTGNLTDVDIGSNTVTSASPYTDFNGIYVSGSVGNVKIHNNTVANRDGPAIALASQINHTLSEGTVANNILTEDLVGISISGATNVNVSGNFVQATTSTSQQNPAFRQFSPASGVIPTNIHTSGNYFETGAGPSYTANIDAEVLGNTSWPPLNSTFEKNTIGGPNNGLLLYLRGSSIFVDGNTFTNSGGTLFLDYDGTDGVATTNILVGSNWWFGNATVYVGGGGINNTLFQNIQVAPQIATGTVTTHNIPGNAQPIAY